MAKLLRSQLESYSRHAWEIDHRRAMQCADLEDWLDFGLSLLHTIDRINERHRARLAAGHVTFDPTVIEHINALYELWFAPCNHLLGEISAFEDDGYAVENAVAFREACHRSHIPGLEPETLQAASQQFDQGRGRPLEEVMDAVRRRTLG